MSKNELPPVCKKYRKPLTVLHVHVCVATALYNTNIGYVHLFKLDQLHFNHRLGDPATTNR